MKLLVIAFLGVLASAAAFNGAKDVTFYLYTQNNPKKAEKIKLDDDSTSPSFNPSNPTRFAIHGFMMDAGFMDEIRDAYIDTGKDYNIVIVDWSGPSHSLTASKQAIKVGQYIGEVIQHLIDNRGLNPDDLYILGHSLGAHVAGVAGSSIGSVASMVVGLDPGDGMDSNDPAEKLDGTDGKVVQVIHTNGGMWGSYKTRGTVDFFPNGGYSQSGCNSLEEIAACSHIRARKFYAESINSDNFIAAECDSLRDYNKGLCKEHTHAIMGEHAPHNLSGIYYLATRSKSPYAKGDTGL